MNPKKIRLNYETNELFNISKCMNLEEAKEVNDKLIKNDKYF